MGNNRWLQVLIILLVIIAATYLLGQVWMLLGQFSGVLGLFFAAWLLAFILSPLARALSLRGMPYGLAVGIVYGLLLLLFVGIGLLVFPALASQIQELINNTSRYTAQIEQLGTDAETQLRAWGIKIEDLNFDSLYGTAAAQLQNIGVSMLGMVTGVASFLLNTVLMLLISFYMMKDGENILANLLRLLPANFAGEAKLLSDSIARAFGGFIRGQLLFGVMYGVINAFVMMVFHLDYILITSIVAGFMMLVPLVGSLLAYFPPILILLVTPGQQSNWWILGIVLIVIQTLMIQVISPRIMSQAVGMHPLFVIGAMLGGAQIAGLFGAVFGIPVLGVMALVARPFLQRLLGYLNSPSPAYNAALELRPATPRSDGGVDTSPSPNAPDTVPQPATKPDPRQPAPTGVVRGLAWLAATARRRK